MRLSAFVLHMLPLTVVSFALICVMILVQKNQPLISQTPEQSEETSLLRSRSFWAFVLLFAVCTGGVLRLVPYGAVLAVVTIAVLFLNRTLFGKVNYSLLATFAFFFILIGNLGRVEVIRQMLNQAIAGRELWFGIGISQIVSNVPAAMLLSGFSKEYGALLWGVNIGGLGTLIASMASLISYQFYSALPGAKKGRYMGQFTLYNLAALAVLTAAAFTFLALG